MPLHTQVLAWLDHAQPDAARLTYTAVANHDGPAYFVVRHTFGNRYRSGEHAYNLAMDTKGLARGPVVFDTDVVRALCQDVEYASIARAKAESRAHAAEQRAEAAETATAKANVALITAKAELATLRFAYKVQWWSLVVVNVGLTLMALGWAVSL